MRRTPAEIEDFIRANYLSMDLQELTDRINETFGTDYSYKAISSLKKSRGLKGAPKKKVYSDVFPKEVCDFIKANYKGRTYWEMIGLLKEYFGREYKPAQIKAFYGSRHLNSGMTGRFKKGQPSYNKGKKMPPEVYERAKATMFKKGMRPHNAANVGDEALTTDRSGKQYIKVKVAEPNKWEFKHKLVWRQERGPIPKGGMISFRDGDTQNCSIENLFLETHQEHIEMNRRGYRSSIPELTDVGLNVARLRIATQKRRKAQ